jgi:hypothetical protein
MRWIISILALWLVVGTTAVNCQKQREKGLCGD